MCDLKSKRAAVRLLYGTLISCLVSACGGGGDGNGGTDTWGLQFLSFDSGAATLDLSAGISVTQFSPSWQAGRTGGNPTYWVRIHLVPANAVNPVLSDDTAILGANCGPNITGCDSTGLQACSYVVGSTPTTRRIDCGDIRGMWRTRDRTPGAYAVIGQLCHATQDNLNVCAEKPSASLTLR